MASLERFQSQAWNNTFSQLKDMMMLPRCVGTAVSFRSERFAFWNPYVAGTFLSFLTFQLSLDGGSQLVDSYAQLRLVLHCYHALRDTDALEEEIPLLESMDRAFQKSRGIWEGGKPSQTEYLKRFCLCFGFSPNLAQQIDDDTQRLIAKGAVSSASSGSSALLRNGFDVNDLKMNDLQPRRLAKLKTGEVSETYRLACQHDFDKLHKGHPQRVVSTLRSIRREGDLLGLNLIRLGGILQDFVTVLGDALSVLQRENGHSHTRSVAPPKNDGASSGTSGGGTAHAVMTSGRRRRRPVSNEQTQATRTPPSSSSAAAVAASASMPSSSPSSSSSAKDRAVVVYGVSRIILGHCDAGTESSDECRIAAQCFKSFFDNLHPGTYQLWEDVSFFANQEGDCCGDEEILEQSGQRSKNGETNKTTPADGVDKNDPMAYILL